MFSLSASLLTPTKNTLHMIGCQILTGLFLYLSMVFRMELKISDLQMKCLEFLKLKRNDEYYYTANPKVKKLEICPSTNI